MECCQECLPCSSGSISSSKDPKEIALDLAKASFLVREGFIFIVSAPFLLTVLSERNSLCRFTWQFCRGFVISYYMRAHFYFQSYGTLADNNVRFVALDRMISLREEGFSFLSCSWDFPSPFSACFSAPDSEGVRKPLFLWSQDRGST